MTRSSYPTADVYNKRDTPPEPEHQTSRRSSTLKIALGYASKDVPNIPLNEKLPHYARGVLDAMLKDATTERSRITAWWHRWPHANIGIPTGGISGIVVDRGGRPRWRQPKGAPHLGQSPAHARGPDLQGAPPLLPHLQGNEAQEPQASGWPRSRGRRRLRGGTALNPP
jgi:bifunctional DNA primase/polymerase-like protein